MTRTHKSLAALSLLLLSLSNLLGGINCFATATANNINNHINNPLRSATNAPRFASSPGSSPDTTSTVNGSKKENDSEQMTRDKAIVVGGGPVGLAAALMLSNAPHNYDVTVYEASTKEDYQEFDPAKAYLYLLNERGQVFTKQYPKLHQTVRDYSVPSTTGFVRVPADPKDPVPEPKVFTANPTNKKKAKDVSEGDPGQIGNEIAEEPGYWIQRHLFSNLLLEAVEEQEKERSSSKNESQQGSITCHFGTKCLNVFPTKDNSSVTVRTTSTNSAGDSEGSVATASLVVAGDGLNSKVRECLATDNNKSESYASFANLDPKYRSKQFKVKKYRNPATNLRLKALKLPPNFPMNDETNDAGTQTTTGEISYSISGVATGPRDFLRLGCLPCKQLNTKQLQERPANAITRPDHVIWKITDGEEMRNWFQKNFPRMNFKPQSEGGMIADAEWERFAKAEGIRFPHDQYSPALQVSLDTTTTSDKTNDSSNKDCGIVLLGDAAHAFPPSIGQGINSGLADVIQLDKSLRGSTESGDNKEQERRPSLSQALKHYEQIQAPETKALIRLARFGSPYQYR